MNERHSQSHSSVHTTRTHTSIHMANKQVLIRLSWWWEDGKVAHITRQLGAQLEIKYWNCIFTMHSIDSDTRGCTICTIAWPQWVCVWISPWSSQSSRRSHITNSAIIIVAKLSWDLLHQCAANRKGTGNWNWNPNRKRNSNRNPTWIELYICICIYVYL